MQSTAMRCLGPTLWALVGGAGLLNGLLHESLYSAWLLTGVTLWSPLPVALPAVLWEDRPLSRETIAPFVVAIGMWACYVLFLGNAWL